MTGRHHKIASDKVDYKEFIPTKEKEINSKQLIDGNVFISMFATIQHRNLFFKKKYFTIFLLTQIVPFSSLCLNFRKNF